MREKRSAKSGFTLVEVIVVLVILAILAAILIPAMTGWIDKAKERRLITACRTCVTAAQTLVAEAYGDTGVASVPGESDVKALAGVPGSVSGVSLANTAVATLTYTDDASGEAVTYLLEPEPHYTVGGGAAHALGTPADMDEISRILQRDGQNDRVDSLAANSATTRAYTAVQSLESEAGIDLAALGAKSWKYDKDGTGPMLEWTAYDISKMKVGDTFPIIRYRTNGVYTVWEAKVESHDCNQKDASGNEIVVNAIASTGKQLSKDLTTDEKKDYSKVSAIYDAAIASGDYGAP